MFENICKQQKLSKKYEFCKLSLTSELHCSLWHWELILGKSCSVERYLDTNYPHQNGQTQAPLAFYYRIDFIIP